VTSPTTRATRRCAGRCCGRIDLVPSRRFALAWLLWLLASLGALAGGVAVPWTVRLALGLILAGTNLVAIRACVLLRGSRAVRRVAWDDAGRFHVWLGASQDPCPASLHAASFRLGIGCVVLWFSTPAGRRAVLIDAGRQDPVAFRGLARHLARGMLIPSGPKV
jgi:hypothetical protein